MYWYSYYNIQDKELCVPFSEDFYASNFKRLSPFNQFYLIQLCNVILKKTTKCMLNVFLLIFLSISNFCSVNRKNYFCMHQHNSIIHGQTAKLVYTLHCMLFIYSQLFGKYEHMLEEIVDAIEPLLDSSPVYLPHVLSSATLMETLSQLPNIKSVASAGNAISV